MEEESAMTQSPSPHHKVTTAWHFPSQQVDENTLHTGENNVIIRCHSKMPAFISIGWDDQEPTS